MILADSEGSKLSLGASCDEVLFPEMGAMSTWPHWAESGPSGLG